MDSTDVLSLLEQLDDEIDELEDSLAPISRSPLADTASKLPLLDKAKLYVLVTCAIESIIFSYLRLNGVEAREHKVFQELTRVKQYFSKISTAETPVAKRELGVDKSAAARFIKAGLSGNDKYDLERAERQAKERAMAHLKLKTLPPNGINAAPISSGASDEASSPSSESSDSSQVEVEAQAKEEATSASKVNKRKAESNLDKPGLSDDRQDQGSVKRRRNGKQKEKKAKRGQA